MIIQVSIVDKHKPAGSAHVGTYTFEIDYPADSHFDFLVVAGEATELTKQFRKQYLNRLVTADEMVDPVNGRGEPVKQRRQ